MEFKIYEPEPEPEPKNLRFLNCLFLENVYIRRYEVVIHTGRRTLKMLRLGKTFKN